MQLVQGLAEVCRAHALVLAHLLRGTVGEELAEVEHEVSEVQLRADFRRALDALPPEQRDVFVLYEESGLSLEEIGNVTGVVSYGFNSYEVLVTEAVTVTSDVSGSPAVPGTTS